MKIYFYRPNDEQFWIGCSEEEAARHFFPKMKKDEVIKYLYIRRENSDRRGLTHLYKKMYGLKTIKDLPEVFLNVSRDLKVCFVENPWFPVGPLWNGYCPFRICDHKTFENTKELKTIQMTYNGIPYEQVDHENECLL